MCLLAVDILSTSTFRAMSAEELVTDALQTPLNNNAEAADDVKKMLAKLKGDGDAQESEKTNGTSLKANGSPGVTAGNDADGKENDDRHPDRRHRDDDGDEPRYRRDREVRGGGRGHRGSRGGRGGSRGDFKPYNKRDNIKSNLVQEEESDDPVAIREQVKVSSLTPRNVF